MSQADQLARTHLAPDPADLSRLVAGTHHNPHGVLGPTNTATTPSFGRTGPTRSRSSRSSATTDSRCSTSSPGCSPWRCRSPT